MHEALADRVEDPVRRLVLRAEARPALEALVLIEEEDRRRVGLQRRVDMAQKTLQQVVERGTSQRHVRHPLDVGQPLGERLGLLLGNHRGLVAGVDFLLETPAVGHVPAEAENAHRSPARVALHVRLRREPVNRSVRPHRAQLDLVVLSFLDRPLHSLGERRPVVRVEELEHRLVRRSERPRGEPELGPHVLRPMHLVGGDVPLPASRPRRGELESQPLAGLPQRFLGLPALGDVLVESHDLLDRARRPRHARVREDDVDERAVLASPAGLIAAEGAALHHLVADAPELVLQVVGDDRKRPAEYLLVAPAEDAF